MTDIVTFRTPRRTAETAAGAQHGAHGKRCDVEIPADLLNRMQRLAVRIDAPIEACLAQAVADFADCWEDHLRLIATVHEPGAAGAALRVIGETTVPRRR